MTSIFTRKQNIQYFCVCLFFASLNFEMFSPLMEDFSVAKMAALLYLGVMMVTSRNVFSINNIKRPLYLAFAMFFLIVLSSVIHININTSIVDTTLFLNIIMFWVLLNHHRCDYRVFHEGLLWFSFTSFLTGVFFFLRIGVTVMPGGRFVVFGENANVLGLKMAVGSLFLLNYCINHSQEEMIFRPWLLAATIPMILLLLATASRVALFAFAVGAILFVVFRPVKRNRSKAIWLFVGILFLLVGYQFLLQQDVMMARMDESLKYGDLDGRDVIWKAYWDVIVQNPILGVGLSGANAYSTQVFGMVKSPHNVIIEVALYSGILGLSCFLGFLTHYFLRAWRYKKFRKNLGPLITSMTVLGMVLSGQALDVKLFWVLAAYAISYNVSFAEQ